MSIPEHLAIIMDGNGRWAEQRHLPRIIGHRKGVDTVKATVDECLALGIKHLTLFAFSSENWGRPRDEIDALMSLLGKFLQKELRRLQAMGIRLQAIGETDRLPANVRKILDDIIEETADNQNMTLTLALSYGSRNEIVRAIRSIGDDVAAGRLDPAAIDDKLIDQTLDTAGIPDPDLLIRTSGETRISNFLLWQLAYAELYFTETLWPDFSEEHLREAISIYGRRQRRFGLTGAQLQDDAEAKEDRH
jgi:undecaprenyl diphosphate synthase